MPRTSPPMCVIWKKVSCCPRARCRKIGRRFLLQPPLQRVRAGSEKLIAPVRANRAVGPRALRLVVTVVKHPNLSVPANRADTGDLEVLIVHREPHRVAVD